MTDEQKRERNKATLKAMLQACGVKDFDKGMSYLTEDVYCDWPYLPIPDMPDTMVGRDTLHKFFVEGQADFAGLSYEIQNIFDMLDPDLLIAEYDSHSRHLESGIPYNNKYLGIFRFRDGQISYWREYIDPLTIKAVFDAVQARQG